jgi:uncharacterized protein
MVDQATIAKAANLILQAAPGSKVMLFGSYATGKATPQSDVDLLVVEPQLGSRRMESTRLKRILQPLGIPIDLIVVSQASFDSWSRVPNAITNLPSSPTNPYSPINFGVRLSAIFSTRPAAASTS